MAWDSSRPVPWNRLVRDWVLYVGIMAVVFLIIYRDRLTPGVFAGLLISGPMFVAIGAVLAKFGYQRKSLKDLRAESARQAAEKQAAKAGTSGSGAAAPRPKPAPTRRTSSGRNRPNSKQRRR